MDRQLFVFLKPSNRSLSPLTNFSAAIRVCKGKSRDEHNYVVVEKPPYSLGKLSERRMVDVRR